MRNGQRHHTWVFTTNRPTEEDALPTELDAYAIRYYAYQLESGENGTPHYQGVISFVNARSMAGLKKLKFFARSYLAVCQDFEAAVAYVQKPEGRLAGPWVLGQPLEPGKRNDLEEVVNVLRTTRRRNEVILDYPKVSSRCLKYVDRVFSLVSEDESRERHSFLFRGDHCSKRVYWLFGRPGSGKSRAVYPLWEQKKVYRLGLGTGSKGSIWFDGYDGEPGLWIDDLSPDDGVSVTTLLNLLDVYPTKVQEKGSSFTVLFLFVVITSNFHPKDFSLNPWTQDALMRRITDLQVSNYSVEGVTIQLPEVVPDVSP